MSPIRVVDLKRFLLAAGVVALATPLACGRPAPPPVEPAAAPPLKIVTSFYPLQIMAMNLTADLPGVTVENLTGPMSGCPHDHQLAPEALRSLAAAAVLVVNGAGLEGFIEKIAAQYPALVIIDASQGFGPAPDHPERAGMDPHIWVSVSGAMHQVRTIAAGLAAADPARAERYRANADRYLARLEALRHEMRAALAPLPNRRIVTFHEAFTWFAREFDLEVVAVVKRHPGAEPGAGELARIIRRARAGNVRAVFTEPQYSPRAAEIVAREIGARVHQLDPAATGPEHPDAYLEIMRANLATLKKALAS